MKTPLITIIALGAIWLTSCNKGNLSQKNEAAAFVNTNDVTNSLPAIPDTLVDAGALPQTKNLYHKLKQTALTGVLFGHQDDRIQGVYPSNWMYTANKSDVKFLVGEYPGIVGHELGNLEINLSYNADGLNFAKIKQSIIDHYDAGGVISLVWGCANPIDSALGRKAAPTIVDSTIKKLFDSTHPERLARYCRWMDNVATFLKGLKGTDGKVIPVLFRTLHEQNGGWFWWGSTQCTPAEYITMWRYTVNYLKFNASVHNLLYVYAPSSFNTQADYMARYPGSNYIDILAADIYDNIGTHSTFATKAGTMVNTMHTLAQNAHKPYGIAESGLDTIPVNNWWTGTFKPLIRSKGMSFALVWRNVRLSTVGTTQASYYCAFTGQTSAADFGSFHGDTVMYFLNKAASKNYYLP